MAALNDIYEVKVFCFAVDQVGINVLHYKVTAVGGTGPTEQQIADAFAAGFGTYMPPLVNMTADYKGVAIRRLVPGPVGGISTSSLSAAAGSGTGDILPRQVSGVITVRTAVGGRKGRGRIYIPFPSEGDNTSAGHPSAGYIANAISLYTNMAIRPAGTAPNTANFTLGVYHRSTQTIDITTSGFARNTWGTQRRRGDYGKRNVVPAL